MQCTCFVITLIFLSLLCHCTCLQMLGSNENYIELQLQKITYQIRAERVAVLQIVAGVRRPHVCVFVYCKLANMKRAGTRFVRIHYHWWMMIHSRWRWCMYREGMMGRWSVKVWPIWGELVRVKMVRIIRMMWKWPWSCTTEDVWLDFWKDCRFWSMMTEGSIRTTTLKHALKRASGYGMRRRWCGNSMWRTVITVLMASCWSIMVMMRMRRRYWRWCKIWNMSSCPHV